jgi:peptide/nickel transport system substrate-binding protein
LSGLRPQLLVLPAVLSCCALLACGGGSGGGSASLDGPTTCDPVKGGKLTVATNEDLPTFDPGQNYTGGDTTFAATPLVFDRLLVPSTDLKKLEPQLATQVKPNADFTEYTIELRDGVKFQDGSSFDAADVAFTFDYYTSKGYTGYALGPISKVTEVDPLTVRVSLKTPYAQFPSEGLASWLTGYVLPKDLAGKSPEEFFQRPIGTGPYEITSFRPSTGVKLKRNLNYWDAQATHLDEIELRIVPDANNRILGLKSGEFDVISRVPGDQVETLPEDSVVRDLQPSAATDDLLLNSRVALLADPKVREAMSLALDRESIAAGAYGGFAEPATGIIGPGFAQVSAPESHPYRFDLARAKRLIADSKFPDGGSATLRYLQGNTNLELEAQLIQEQLSAIGIDLKVQPIGLAESNELAPAGKIDISLLHNAGGYSPDPIDFLTFYIDTGGYNGRWPTKPVEAIVGDLVQTDDLGEQQELYSQYEQFTADTLGQIPVLQPRDIDAHSSAVSGLDMNPLNDMALARSWVCGS